MDDDVARNYIKELEGRLEIKEMMLGPVVNDLAGRTEE
jgi:hypothetical protein